MIEVLLDSPNWTSQITHGVVASLEDEQSVWAVLMCLFAIATEYNGPLAAAHAHIDADRYVMGFHAARQPKLFLLSSDNLDFDDVNVISRYSSSSILAFQDISMGVASAHVKHEDSNVVIFTKTKKFTPKM